MRLPGNIALRGNCSPRAVKGFPQSHSSLKATAGPNAGVLTLQNAGPEVCLPPLRACTSSTGPGGAAAAGLGPCLEQQGAP